MMRRPRLTASPTLLAIALSVLGTLFVLYVHPAYAQAGSTPDKPEGLEATASHGQVVLTWRTPRTRASPAT